MALDDDVKDHLNEKFDDFISGLIKKFRWPAIGLAVVFAAFMSAFATYMYVKARSDVSAAQVQFYQNLMQSQKEIDALKKQMILNFNDFINDFQAQKEEASNKLTKLIDEAQELSELQEQYFRDKIEESSGTGVPNMRALPPPYTIYTPIEPKIKEKGEDKLETPKKEYTIPEEFLQQQHMQQALPRGQ